MPTQTITLQYGPTAAGPTFGFTASSFAWTITNVQTYGTFVDGTPWIVMGSTGSYLTDILPRSEGRTTTHINSRYPALVNVYINGSAKNPKTPYGSYNPTTMTEVEELGVFDSRVKFAASEGTQAFINSLYGLTLNIGYTSGGPLAALNPVGLTFNDVIVTADSIWIDQSHPWIGLTLNTGPENGNERIGLGDLIPNTIGVYKLGTPNTIGGISASGGNGTPIRRLGVLNVLPSGFTGLTQSCFRPPAQWKSDTTSRYNFMIPLSAARGITEISNIFGHRTTDQSIYTGLPFRANQYFDSLWFHGGNEIRRSTTAPLNGSENISLINGHDYEMYPVLERLLFDMTNTFNTVAQRELARNRFIQYGIDAFGAIISGVNGGEVSGGHRNSEFLPPILITSWLLGQTYGAPLLDIYNTIRSNFPGLSASNDEQIGYYLFSDWSHFMGVTTNPDMGRFLRQTWSPTSPNATYVTSAEIVRSALFHGNNVGSTFGSGKYGKLYVSGGNFPSPGQGRGFFMNSGAGQRGNSPYNYPGCYIKVTAGPGSGNTIYKILEVGKLATGQDSAADYLIVDRPWFNGLPDNTSTVECYPFRNGIHSFDGSTADLGRYYYNSNPVTKYSTEGTAYNAAGSHTLSYAQINYGLQQWRGRIVICTFLKKLFEISGGVGGTTYENYISHDSFKYYTDVVLGYNRYIGDNSLLGTTPRQERIQHIKWNEIKGNTAFGGPDNNVRIGNKSLILVVEQWMGITGATQFGKAEWSTFPGYGLTYNASALSRVLANWGGPGNSDFNGDGITDSLDLAFITSNWGS